MKSPLATLARKIAAASLAGLLAIVPLSKIAANAAEIHGAGSTFAAPLYASWIGQLQKEHPEIAISYRPVGSGEGLALFTSGAVDFAGSDVPLSAASAQKVERGVVQFPSTAGLIVLAYNLPGVSGELKLPRDVYADIFLGRLQNWDDPRIVAANPGLHLPSMTIAVIGRLDSSGTTYAFTSHLAAVSGAWSDIGPGVGKVVAWPRIAMLARGNEGVASKIQISEGSIGYVEYGFARRLGLPVAALENRDGQFVAPSPDSGAAAITASAGRGLDGLAASMLNPPGAGAYPIVTYSWLVLHRKYPAEQGRDLKAFLRFGLDKGQGAALDLGYIPLPSAVAELGRNAADLINSDASMMVAPK